MLHDQSHPVEGKIGKLRQAVYLVEEGSVKENSLPVYVTWAFLLCII